VGGARKLVLACLLFAAASMPAGATPVPTTPAPATPTAATDRDQVTVSFFSPALDGVMHALVFLPAGYETGDERYPVVYFLHGLPAPPSAYTGSKWLADAIQDTGKPAILVEPQGSRTKDTDPEYLNWGPGRNWETYVAHDLVAYVDSTFRTIPTRDGRALVGESAGGYGAIIIGLHHLQEFAAIQSWSGYFHATDPTGTTALDRGPETNAHNEIAQLVAQDATSPTSLSFYVGRADKLFAGENIVFDRELTEAHVPHLFELYAGGHAVSLWRAHAAGWLALAFGRLTAAFTDP